VTRPKSAGASPRTPAVSIAAQPGALQRQVPVRTILTTIGLVLATVVAVLFVMQVERVLVWMVVALFFTVALYPVVAWLQRRVVHRRSLATLLVFLVALLIIGGLLTAFAVPLAQEGTQLAGQLPALINDARAGRGPVGDLLERTNALQWVQNNEDRIREFATGLGTPALTLVQGASTAAVATVTIFVLSYLAVLEGVRAENPVTVFEQHVPARDLDITVPTRASMIACCGPRTRLSDARSRAELASAARPLRRRQGRRDPDASARGRGTALDLCAFLAPEVPRG
jgi:hypothetical protein